MKPTEPDIAWALKNRDLVARWLEQRGGWQWTDNYVEVDGNEPSSIGLVSDFDNPEPKLICPWHEIVWLPSVGDVLEMLAAKGLLDICFYWIYGIWGYRAMLSRGSVKGEGKTYLIAFCELLKAVENG